jgi:hypothetical protein
MLINTGSIAQNNKAGLRTQILGKLGLKPKRSGPICKGFSMVEGYTYETENLRDVKAKACCKEGLTGTLPVDPVARIDLGRRIKIGRPGGVHSGAAAHWRRRAHQRAAAPRRSCPGWNVRPRFATLEARGRSRDHDALNWSTQACAQTTTPVRGAARRLARGGGLRRARKVEARREDVYERHSRAPQPLVVVRGCLSPAEGQRPGRIDGGGGSLGFRCGSSERNLGFRAKEVG